MSSILCVDDDPAVARQLETDLRQLGHEPFLTSRVHAALEALRRRRFDLVLSTFRLPDGTGLELLDALGDADDPAPVLIMTAHGNSDEAVASMRHGAVDFITRPLRHETLRLAVQHALEIGRLRRENADFRRRFSALQGSPPVVGRSPELRRVLEMIESVAPTRATVLLEGESGSGKELYARTIHDKSPRRDHPMVTVHCAALSAGMAESELFGEEQAGARREGAFERAHQGTLLLDEISGMSLRLQGRLLRMFQQQEFERVGGTRPVRVDVRLIATTRRDLREEVAAGRFRRDLYYRLSVVNIRAPALRERLDDLPVLIEHFAEQAAQDLGIRMPSIPAETFEGLRRHSWPGNVRELSNAIERAVILCRDGVLTIATFDLRVAGSTAPGPLPEPGSETYDLETLKRDALRRALIATGGRRARAAKLLGISERTLRNMLHRERSRESPEMPGSEARDRPSPPPDH